MSDPFQVLRAKRAKIIEDAKQEIAGIDHDLRELELLRTLANKYGLAVVADSDEAGHAFQPEAGHLFQPEPIRGSALISGSLRRRLNLT
jgi:hypothetical protein